MKLNFIIIICSFIAFNSIGQEEEYESTTSLLLYSNWSSTFRKLEVNEGLFADSIGARGDEVKSSLWSFGLGFRNNLTKNLSWEGGLALQKNGEEYLYEETDTLYKYSSEYHYISMPIKLYYRYGNSFRVIGGVGVVPQMLVKYEQDLETRSTSDIETSEKFKTTIGYSSFVVSTVFNLGIEYDITSKVTLLVIPEYKLQLTSSYLKTNSFKHYGRSFGLNIGVLFEL